MAGGVMFALPEWIVKLTPADELDFLLEWRLSTADVADMCGVTMQAVNVWATRGFKGRVLRSRQFSSAPRARRAYRLGDVMEFARHADRPVDLRKLNPTLARQWGVDTSAITVMVDT